uniref:Protein MAIN-LIKE 1-like n=1 Tax=Cicer arietinum TaxID=3827 RepID=A0A1S2Z231_CICAR|nr:protein MAIN-LIKE 1-like [Cicer arietinum]
MAQRLWEGEDRRSLKVITNGLKLKKFVEVPVPDLVEHWIRESRLMLLSSGYLTMADASLISAFVKRWHKETYSFHLPFGEMTITLDEVATLLYISPHGKFFDAPVNMNTNNAARAAYEYLGATWEEACVEISYNKCAQYRLQWLRDLYSRLI